MRHSTAQRTMTRASALLLTAVLVLSVATPTPASGTAAAGHAAPVRYLDEVFTEVEATLDVHYRSTTDLDGNPIDLRLDIYEPTGDTAERRPAVVFFHGGWFAFGSKNGMGPVVRPYVERGYVAIAVQYRIDPDNGWDTFTSIDQAMSSTRFLQSVVRAYEDAAAAVAWVRSNAESLRVHENAITVAGHSAGAVLSMLLAFARDVNAPDTPGHPSRVAAAMPWSGTIPTSLVQLGEPPIHVSHGTADTTIPYSAGKVVCDAAIAVGNVCEMFTLDGVGHGLTAHRDQIIGSEAPFLFDNVLAPLGFSALPLPAPGEPAPEPPHFSDVGADHPHAEAIICVAAAGFATGYADGTYRPGEPVSRQAMVTFLWRLVGRPPMLVSDAAFIDVGIGHPFTESITWAVEEGLTRGYSDGTFRPTAPVSRQASAAFVHRLVADPDSTIAPTEPLIDVIPGHPFETEIHWSIANDLLVTAGDQRFRPVDATTRGEAAEALCGASTLLEAAAAS